jgi:hypothetical protein
MTRQDIVRMSYSQAEARCNPAVDRDGRLSPGGQESWIIWTQNGQDAVELGQGASAEEAWEDAARRLNPSRV